MKRKFRNAKRRVELWWMYLDNAEKEFASMLIGGSIAVVIIFFAAFACYVLGQHIVNPV
ncbi:hypothetical protein GCM10017764_17980 [Sphingobacterium griseoflavum]|uniref:Phage protein n=1 Tax=Sphingobacterium griseoflavum TaxID=1474952 RepID=A0ABQ3HXA7_9SPHI|nr:hypothetical protein GCM10017764_17980 [Sphingobacterium griseoflavum]